MQLGFRKFELPNPAVMSPAGETSKPRNFRSVLPAGTIGTGAFAITVASKIEDISKPDDVE
jgi:hypothetical protein